MRISNPGVRIIFGVFLVCATFVRSEYIFRGQCTRLFQPQELGLTVDPKDVVFNRYVILPANRSVASQDHCQSICLGNAEPPCRSALYDPASSSCWLLRADKDTALSFDLPGEDPKLLSGVLIAPQTITELVADRNFGVANCDNYCPAPAYQSADTITPVCIKDCANSNPICAGELSNCMDFPRQVFFSTTNTIWKVSSFPYPTFAVTFPKKYDFTHLRVTINFASWNLVPYYYAGPSGYHSEGWFYVNFLNGLYNCNGEANWHIMGREIGEGYLYSGEIALPMHGEFSCVSVEFPKGDIDLKVVYEYRGYDNRFGASSTIGLFQNNQRAPSFIYVEEYIPAKWLYKLDDMTRCQSATVFNSQTTQWNAISTTNTVGKSSFALYKYKKRSDTSALRIYWGGYIYMNVITQKCVHFYFTINDQICSDPAPIETSFRDIVYYYGYPSRGPHSTMTQLDGICRGLPAGRYDIELWIDSNCPTIGDVGSSYNFYLLGRGRPSGMIVEEIHENLPINGVLMSDGSLVRMPNYNRQYFVFTGGCQALGSTCLTTVKSYTYKKLQSASGLHIKWFGTQEYCTDSSASFNETIRFYVKINGNECSNPLKIESWWYNGLTYYGFCSLQPKYVEGVCEMPVAAGPVTISLHVGVVTSSTRTTGVTIGGTSYLMVEELYDSL